MKRILSFVVRTYRAIISPLLGANKCRFAPTCSEYALSALDQHGSLKGTVLTLWRVLRCNPFCKGGYDPVPCTKHKHS